ncbi:MAG: hypothetical protein LBF34_03405 [Puniceicoccales bacterium]|jgi:F0F1-type ATP synthase delta subunit|nr:hypothetical protein [Puniceicoccales bacterium]
MDGLYEFTPTQVNGENIFPKKLFIKNLAKYKKDNTILTVMKSKYYPLFTSFFVGNVIYGIKVPSAVFLPESKQLPFSVIENSSKAEEAYVNPPESKQLLPQLIGNSSKAEGILNAILPEQEQLSPQFIKNLLRTEGTLNTYARLTAMVEKKLLAIKDNIDWINDLMERINEIFKNKPEMRAILDKLNERLKILNKAYQACIKELKYEPQGNCSLLANVIKDLKELQDVTQEFRNSTRNLLDCIRLLLSANQDISEPQRLRSTKSETKLVDQHGYEMIEIIDQIINSILIPALGAFNECAREERGRGITGSQSNRAL